jgi:Tfp pilus assembly protein PilX
MTDPFPMKVGLSRRRPIRPRPGQAGAATLAVAVIMLLVVSVLVFHSHTAGWLEQRATANQARAKQAHAAAEAGLEAALAVLNADTGTPKRGDYLTVDADGTFSSNGVTLTESPGSGLAYSVTFTAVSDPANTFRIQSTGESDCSNGVCAGKATVSQVVRAIGLSRLQAISTCSNCQSEVNEAVFFESIFNASMAEVKSLARQVSPSDPLDSNTEGLVWHEGARTITSAVGSETKPVLLVVNGDLTLTLESADKRLYGFIYVRGTITCTVCPDQSIFGGLAVTVSPPLGSSKVDKPVAVPNVLTKLETVAPRFAKVLGTWKDWN